MPFILIKNNLKLILRSKWIVIILVFGYVAVTAVVSGAFEELMKSYNVKKEFQAGYRIDESSEYFNHMQMIKERALEAGITFVDYPLGEIKQILETNNCLVFVEFNKKDYAIYRTNENKAEGAVLEYFLNRLVSGLPAGQNPGADIKEVQIPFKQLKAMPNVEAKDYYGIAYIVYFIWFSYICLTPIFSSERKYGIDKKYKTTPISNFGLYLAKAIPGVIVIVTEILLSVLLATYLFHIKWGNYPYTILILFLNVLAGTALGLMFSLIFRNLAISVASSFTVITALGFFGGTFETYLYSSYPPLLKQLSPVYYVNRVLIEYSAMGKSDYTVVCILYLAAVIIVCSIIGIAAQSIKREEKV